jgi:hypothetical protein
LRRPDRQLNQNSRLVLKSGKMIASSIPLR